MERQEGTPGQLLELELCATILWRAAESTGCIYSPDSERQENASSTLAVGGKPKDWMPKAKIQLKYTFVGSGAAWYTQAAQTRIPARRMHLTINSAPTLSNGGGGGGGSTVSGGPSNGGGGGSGGLGCAPSGNGHGAHGGGGGNGGGGGGGGGGGAAS
uniref:Uncharacterized protein n=1 Tax=Anopheles atroparvus TaxID=41427 RepID=A0A182IKR3_ANOAO